MPARKIVTVSQFDEAVAALGSPAATRLVRALSGYLAEHPERAPAVHGLGVRVLHCRPYADYPALRLFYGYDASTLYLLDITPYDELSG